MREGDGERISEDEDREAAPGGKKEHDGARDNLGTTERERERDANTRWHVGEAGEGRRAKSDVGEAE